MTLHVISTSDVSTQIHPPDASALKVRAPWSWTHLSSDILLLEGRWSYNRTYFVADFNKDCSN